MKEDIEGIRYCVLVGNERFYQFLEFCNSLQEAREIAYDYSESNAHHGVHNEEFWAFDTKKWKAYLPKYFEQGDQQFNPNLPIYIEGDDGRSERFINYINRLVNNRKDESIMVKKLNLRESDDKITAKSFDELISKLKRHGYDCKDCYEGDEYLYLRKNGDPYQAEYYKKNDGTYELYLGNIHPTEEKNEGCCGKKCKSESVRTRRVSRRLKEAEAIGSEARSAESNLKKLARFTFLIKKNFTNDTDYGQGFIDRVIEATNNYDGAAYISSKVADLADELQRIYKDLSELDETV